MRHIARALVIVVISIGCAPERRSDDMRSVTETAAEASRPEEFIASTAEAPQLAIEVEVTESGIRPVGAQVLRGPRPTNAARPDLAVEAPSERGELRYTIVDPRFAEVEGEGARIMESARAFIYVPLDFSVAGVTLRPVETARKHVSRGGAIDTRRLMIDTCRRDPAAAPSACEKVLAIAAQQGF